MSEELDRETLKYYQSLIDKSFDATIERLLASKEKDNARAEQSLDDLDGKLPQEKMTPSPDCPGFLLIHKTDAVGKVTGIEIREVMIRKNSNFYRYKKGDAESRSRAMDKAKAAADNIDQEGLEPFTLTEFPGSDVKSVFSNGQTFSSPLTTGDKILRTVENIFDILWKDRRAKQSEDIMCQDEIEILLEGVRLGQRMLSQARMK